MGRERGLSGLGCCRPWAGAGGKQETPSPAGAVGGGRKAFPHTVALASRNAATAMEPHPLRVTGLGPSQPGSRRRVPPSAPPPSSPSPDWSPLRGGPGTRASLGTARNSPRPTGQPALGRPGDCPSHSPGGDGQGPGSLGGPSGTRSHTLCRARETSWPQAPLSLPQVLTGTRHRCPLGGTSFPDSKLGSTRVHGEPGCPGGSGTGNPRPPHPRAVLPAGATPRVEGHSQTHISRGECHSQGHHPGPPRLGRCGVGGRCRPHSSRERVLQPHGQEMLLQPYFRNATPHLLHLLSNPGASASAQSLLRRS